MATHPVHKWTVEEYLAFEETSDIKHEFMNGEIYAMTGGTRKHSVIIFNINGVLWRTIDSSNCHGYGSEMKVKVDDDNYFYPDANIVCGEEKFEDEKELTLLNPTLVVEVTSPSSESFDKGVKANLYRSIDSLQHYLVVDQHQMYAQLSTRQEGGWFLQQFTQRSESIPLRAINVDLPMSDVYRDIAFEA